MFDAILETYRSFFLVISSGVDRPRQFYPVIVRELDMKSLLGFYIQCIVLVIAFNAVVFIKGDGGMEGFDQFALVISTLDLFIGATVAAVLFWGALKALGHGPIFAETSKYIFTFFIVSSIVTLLLSTISTYVQYALTDNFAYMDDPFAEPPAFTQWFFIWETYVLPLLCVVAFTVLLYVSTGKTLSIPASFIGALAVVGLLVAPATNHVWLSVLQVNYGPADLELPELEFPDLDLDLDLPDA